MADQSGIDLTVVVPTYNQAPVLRECLRSLRNQTIGEGSYEVVVVDDGSSDDTAAVVREFASIVRSIRHPQNRGRSAARNTGIGAARGRVIAFVDSDVIVRADFLEQHLRSLNGRQNILSRGPVITVPSLSDARTARVPRVAASPAYLDTANAVLEKSALVRAGLFDEAFPGYGWEDFELGFRLQRLGVRRVFTREAVGFHVQPPLQPAMLDSVLSKETERARSAVYFYRKHPSVRTRWLIQATPPHRAAYWLLSAGGLLTPERAARVALSLHRARFPGMAQLVLRGALNRVYQRELDSAFHPNGAASIR